MAIKLDSNGQIDPNKFSDKVMPEKETRKKILSWARQLGYEKDMLLLFIKFDKLLKNCTNQQERQDMAQLGWAETLKLMGSYGTFLANGKVIYSKEDDKRNHTPTENGLYIPTK